MRAMLEWLGPCAAWWRGQVGQRLFSCSYPPRVIPANAGTQLPARAHGELGPCLRRDDIQFVCPASALAPLIPAPFDRAILPSLPPRWTGSRANGLRGQGRMEGVAPSLPKFRPAGCFLQGGEGRQWCHGRFRAARGRAPVTGSRGACAETSGVSAPWIWTAGISPLLREAGRSDPPVARHCGSGEVPAVRRSEVETSDRAGEVRPRTHC